MNRVSDLDLRMLRIFVAVTEAGGFSAAESQLNISTSTISIHMSNLEKRIGIRLCSRGRSGFRLTERGQVVYQETRQLLKTLDDYPGVLAGAKSLIAGRLAIGMVDGLVTHPRFPVAQAVRHFNQSDNDVQIELRVASRQSLEHDVVEGVLHAAIGPFVREITGLAFAPLFRERHELYCGKGHALFNAQRRIMARADLSTYPAVIRMYHADFDNARLKVVREAASVVTMEAMLTLLLSGGYIGYLPTHFARPWVESGELSEITRADMGYDSQHHLMTKRASRESTAMERFVGIVHGICDGTGENAP